MVVLHVYGGKWRVDFAGSSCKKHFFPCVSTAEALDIVYMWRYNRTTTIRGIFAPEFAANRTLMEDKTMYDIPVTLTTNPKKKPEDESKLGFRQNLYRSHVHHGL